MHDQAIEIVRSTQWIVVYLVKNFKLHMLHDRLIKTINWMEAVTAQLKEMSQHQSVKNE